VGREGTEVLWDGTKWVGGKAMDVVDKVVDIFTW
jgi:hypothetical protein